MGGIPFSFNKFVAYKMKKKPENMIGVVIAIGVAFGAAIGNVGLGIALGVAIGASMYYKQKNKIKTDGSSGEED
jgi:hypothetical protein